MVGLFFSLLAGILVSIQSVFNTKVGEKIGLWRSSAVVHFVGFVTAMTMMVVMREPMIGHFRDVPKWYYLGGSLGALVVFSVIQGMTRLGVGYTTAIMLISQLLVAVTIDYLGLFGMTKLEMGSEKLIGIVLMIAGIIVFQRK